MRNNILYLHIEGVRLKDSGSNSIFGNIVLQCGVGNGIFMGGGISLVNSHDNIISSNIITNNTLLGLILENSAHNLIYKNVIENNNYGIRIGNSANNMFHHNNFINAFEHVYLYNVYNTTWNDGVEGNYWDDYVGLDDGSGGRVAGDGVGDTDLPHLGVDNYPLISPHDSIPIVWENTAYPVKLLSNSTVSSFRFIQAEKKDCLHGKRTAGHGWLFQRDNPQKSSPRRSMENPLKQCRHNFRNHPKRKSNTHHHLL